MNKVSSFSKKIIFITAFLAMCAVLGTLILPSLLSMPTFKPLLTKLINSRSTFQVSFDQIHLGWTNSEQKIENLLVRDKQGRPLLHVKDTVLPSSLFKLVLNRNFSLIINQGVLELIIDKAGRSNLSYALDVDKNYQIENAQTSKLFIDQALISSNGHRYALDLKGKSFYQQLEGLYTASVILDPLNELNVENFIQTLQSPTTHIDVSFKSFPTIWLDQVQTLMNPSWNFMIAEALGTTLDLNIKKLDGLTTLLQMQLHSPRLSGQTLIELNQSHLQLTQPSLFSWQITPSFWNALKSSFSLKTKFTLNQATMSKLLLNKLSIDLTPSQKLDLKTFQIDAKLNLDNVSFNVSKHLQNVLLENFQSSLSTKNHLIFFDSAGELNHQTFASPFSLKLQSPRYNDLDNALDSFLKAGKVELALNKIPVLFLDEMANTQDLLQKSLGDFLRLNLALTPLEDSNGIALQLDLDSERLKIHQLQSEWQNQTLSVKAEPFEYLLPKDLLSHFTSGNTYYTEKDIPLYLELDQLNLKFSDKGTLDHQNCTFAGALYINPFKFKELPLLGDLSFKNFKLSFQGENLMDFSANLHAQIVHPHPLLGEEGELNLKGNFNFDKSFSQNNRIQLHFASSLSSLEAELLIDDSHLTLLSPTKVAYELDPAVLDSAGLKFNFKNKNL